MIEYMVASPWSSKTTIIDGTCTTRTPMTTVRIEEGKTFVVTKTGLTGLVVYAHLYLWNGKEFHANAVWAPEPGIEYDLIIGAKLALARAIALANIPKSLRTSIWKGFFYITK